jgi:hypothetical protein
MVTTSRRTPQLPTIIPRLQPLEFAWPTDAPNAQWLEPPLHWQPSFIQKLCRGMSSLTSPISSLAWACLPTKIAQLSLHEPQSQSTTQTAIPSSQAGGMRLVLVSGTFLSPLRPLTLRMQPVPQLLSLPSPPTLLPMPPPSVTRLPPPSPVVIPPAMPAATHPHPSQGILAISTSGIACLVY